MERVFGIGFQRTGTTSLGKALEILGYNHCNYELGELLGFTRYWEEDKLNDLFSLIKMSKLSSFEDDPWYFPDMYKKLDKEFPNAKFILTSRNSLRWAASLRRLHNALFKDINSWVGLSSHLRIYDFNETSDICEINYIKKFLSYNDEVKDYFKDRPRKLLVINFEQGDPLKNWFSLCSFLGKSIPNVPFPHANKSVK